MTTASYIFNEHDCNLDQTEEIYLIKSDSRISQVPQHGVPISKLPSELLFEIMLVYKYQYEVGGETPGIPRLKPTYRWIRISHVCRQWRAVALSSPLLWTSIHIPRASPERVRELLRRSHPIPISLTLHDFLIEEALANGFSQFLSDGGMDRLIYRLRLWYPHSSPSDLTRLPLDHLKEFELAVDCRPSKADYHSFLSHVAASSSNLRSLILVEIILNKRLLHDTLTTLSLEAPVRTSDMSWDEFLSALGSMKQLHYLHLDKMLSKLQPGVANQPTLINLPQLHSLTLLHDPTETHMKFLQSISFRPGTVINLNNYTNTIQAFSAAIPLFSQALSLFSSSGPGRFLTLKLAICDGWGWISIGIDYDLPHQFRERWKMRYPCMFDCQIHGAFSLDVFNQSVREFIQWLPFADIRHLHLDCGLGDFPPGLLHTFSTLRELNTLNIDDSAGNFPIIHALVSALPQCQSDCSNNVTAGSSLCASCKSFSQTWFPRLQKLTYEGSGHNEDQFLKLVEKLSPFGYCQSKDSKFVAIRHTTTMLDAGRRG